MLIARKNVMSDTIRTLAQFLTLKKNGGQKFVLMLGAGASLSSGIKTTTALTEELVATYGSSDNSRSVEQRFDDLWRSANADTRLQWLNGCLNATPSSGYRHLAELISVGYFDVVITFNFDRLLERALDDIGFRDYRPVIRGDTDLRAMARVIEARDPRVKILKMHGSLRAADYFLFAKNEMLNYPEEIRALMWELTGRDIIICGYAFSDLCVIKSFNDSPTSGSIYVADPGGAGQNIRGYMVARESVGNVVAGDAGRFDDFFAALSATLTAPAIPASTEPRQNLFKFLDHYQEENKAWFIGRHQLTRTMVRRFNTAPPDVLFLNGVAKIGKTSFIRAGLIPYLDRDKFEPIYVRCRRDLEPHLRSEIGARLTQDVSQLEWSAVAAQLRAFTPKHIVLFLDQFEKPARAWQDSREDQERILAFLKSLLGQCGDRLSVVGIGIDETPFLKLLIALRVPETLEIRPLSAKRVGRVIARAARQAGTPLPPGLLEEMCQGYQQTLDHPQNTHRYTLTHIQTICYYLAKGYYRNWSGYERVPNQGLVAALDSIRDESNLIDLMDDLPASERRMIRSFLKVICDPARNTRQIVEFIRDHFPQIQDDRFPEPLA